VSILTLLIVSEQVLFIFVHTYRLILLSDFPYYSDVCDDNKRCVM